MASNKPDIKYLVAEDMFDPTLKNIFSASTGELLATINKDKEFNLNQQEAAKEEEPAPNKNPDQLSLF